VESTERNTTVEAGNSENSCGQVYVALSQVITLIELYLINYP